MSTPRDYDALAKEFESLMAERDKYHRQAQDLEKLQMLNPPRYVWDEGGRGIWDNKRKCWRLWKTSVGGFEGSEAFKGWVMRVLNAAASEGDAP